MTSRLAVILPHSARRCLRRHGAQYRLDAWYSVIGGLFTETAPAITRGAGDSRAGV